MWGHSPQHPPASLQLLSLSRMLKDRASHKVREFAAALAEIPSMARAPLETSSPTLHPPTRQCWLSRAWQPCLCALANEQRAPLKAWAHLSLSLWRLKMSEEALGPDRSLPLSISVALGRFLSISEPRLLCLAEIKAATSASRGH